ncbi:Fungal specific transcription factor domain-containing protein [Cladophialophora immunda]|nr:Fungal specific transcription factor domain-containing protein [Cladophialophora immunda]
MYTTTSGRFCTRLNQQCSYTRSSDTRGYRIEKDRSGGRLNEESHVDRQRVQRLEARMEQIVDVVNTLVELQSGQSTARFPGTSTQLLRSSSDTPQGEVDGDISSQGGVSRFDPLQRPDPPPEVLQVLVRLYIDRIADQPLPLFDIKSLPSSAPQFSRGLLRSFLALTVRYSNIDFFRNARTRAVEFYKNSASEILFAGAAEPTGDLEALQAFCLLCLSEIADGKTMRAWMALGVAVRMAICSNTMFSTAKTVSPNTDLSRCCWSLFILDRMHGSSFRSLPAIPTEENLPEMPPSGRRPPLALSNRSADLEGVEEKDAGIDSYALQLLSIWGRLMAYLKTIREGKLEEAWTANSVYQQIKSEMSRFETVLPEVHRFKNTRFHDRTISELEEQRGYWAPWVFTQCIYHTIHCTLNHPFLHIARIPGRPRLRSPSFLQHATDQAVLHSAWVVLVLRLCEERNFTIFDPFVGHLASMIATTQFFLQFSKDESLAVKASRDFEMLRRYVEKMANTHSHLLHTVSKLSRLAQFATSQIDAGSNNPPKAETALLWDLLDYAVSSSPIVDIGDSSDNVELNVNTQFLSPINPDAPLPRTALQSSQELSLSGTNIWNDATFEFDMADISSLPDVSALMMPNEAWTGGHL